ncbi:phosphopantetheinyl transferase [Xylariaceae sp. FL1019]|nr:phosphopantetheinyl transferase [Xylariaceae sp. FL1019]
MASTNPVQLLQYIVDTRKLWPSANKSADLATAASRAFALLTDDERKGVARYYFVSDAKMALASHLLKHWVVSKYAQVPWRLTTLTRDSNKKPIFVDGNGKQPVVFNVSHQAGLVTLVAVANYEGAQIGTDIVCTSERTKRDWQVIQHEGWPKFVDMHADVFGRTEAAYLKTGLATHHRFPVLGTESQHRDYKLRAFYTLWCLREAYVKMTGEALLAEWLGDLIFRGFEPPEPTQAFQQSVNDDETTMVTRHDVVFKGSPVEDANICLRALGSDYMTCTAVRTPGKEEDALGWELGPYEFLDIETILDDGEAAS